MKWSLSIKWYSHPFLAAKHSKPLSPSTLKFCHFKFPKSKTKKVTQPFPIWRALTLYPLVQLRKNHPESQLHQASMLESIMVAASASVRATKTRPEFNTSALWKGICIPKNNVSAKTNTKPIQKGWWVNFKVETFQNVQEQRKTPYFQWMMIFRRKTMTFIPSQISTTRSWMCFLKGIKCCWTEIPFCHWFNNKILFSCKKMLVPFQMGGPFRINPNINLIYTLYRRYPPWN